MTNLVDDVAKAIEAVDYPDDHDPMTVEALKPHARAAIAVILKAIDEKCPEVAHIVRARLNAR